jgi:hypothetical protein
MERYLWTLWTVRVCVDVGGCSTELCLSRMKVSERIMELSREVRGYLGE